MDGNTIWSFKFIESGGQYGVDKRWRRMDLWNPPVRTKSLRRKGVVFSLSIAGFVTELRLSGDAIVQKKN